MSKKEFYIGYLKGAPKGIAKFYKPLILALFLIAIAIGIGIASGQRFISNGAYEYGELTELEGLLFDAPVPFLKVSAGKDIYGKEVYKNILLINYGKFGADNSVRLIKNKINRPLNEVQVKLRGTLVYHNGVTLLELTEKEKAYQGSRENKSGMHYVHQVSQQGQTTLTGEIIDPKCYFGSMNPGQGKPHKSCAGLCIAGGIPPMFVVQNDNNQADYYLILGENGEQINQDVIKYVADPSSISGRVESFDEWKVIYIDPKKISLLD